MAGELQVFATTGQTLYAQVYSLDDGTVWNTASSAFQAYQTANIADYDVALTEQGSASGFYVGNLPAGLTTSTNYGFRALRRVGGSPAETDPIVFLGSTEDTAASDPWNVSLPGAYASGKAGNILGNMVANLLAGGDIDGYTLEQTLKLCLAALAGKLSGAGATTVTIRAADDSKNRITATVDSLGNRTVVNLDAAG